MYSTETMIESVLIWDIVYLALKQAEWNESPKKYLHLKAEIWYVAQESWITKNSENIFTGYNQNSEA